MNNGDNFNSQFNNQVPNNNSIPTRSVTNKFFPADLFNNNINEVNSETSNTANSQFISRTTWGVGNNNNNNNQLNNSPSISQSPEVLDLFDDKIETLMDGVNGTTYNQTPAAPVPQAPMPPQPNPQQFNYNQNNINPRPVNPNVNQNNPNPTPPNPNDNYQSWMNSQPLSMGGLGVNTIVGEDAPKEIVENNRFIQPRNYEPASNKAVEPPAPAINSAPSIYNNFNEQYPEIDEVKVSKEYVGPAFTKITMAPFSFYALLFGGIYFIYRKLYVFGLLALVIELAILIIVPTPFSFIGLFIYRLILALIVNHLYIGIVKTRVKILHKHNIKKNQYELSVMAKKKGGTNFLIALLATIVYGLAVFIIGVSLDYKDLLNLLPENNEPVINEDSKGVTGYNGDLTYEEYNIEDNFNITIPKEFTKEGQTFTYIYRVPLPVEEDEPEKDQNQSDDKKTENDSSNQEEKPKEEKPKVEYSNNKCTLSFNAVKGYKDENDLIKSISYYYTRSETEGINTITNNNITWQTFTSSKNDNQIYFHVTKKNDKILLFEYKMEYEDDNHICENFYQSIFNSISSK